MKRENSLKHGNFQGQHFQMKKGTVNACRGRHLHKGGREGRQKRKSNTLARGLSKSTRTWLVRLAAFAAAAFSGDDTRP